MANSIQLNKDRSASHWKVVSNSYAPRWSRVSENRDYNRKAYELGSTEEGSEAPQTSPQLPDFIDKDEVIHDERASL